MIPVEYFTIEKCNRVIELKAYWDRVIPGDDFDMVWLCALNENESFEEAVEEVENYIDDRSIEIQAASGSY